MRLNLNYYILCFGIFNFLFVKIDPYPMLTADLLEISTLSAPALAVR